MSALSLPSHAFSLSSCLLTHPAFILTIFQSFQPPYLSQYFDEEQDDHEYPYYYEETTGRSSSSAPPSPQPGAPSQQVKSQQEGRELQAGFVEGKENEREVLQLIK